MAAKIQRCARCDRRVRSGSDWAVSIGDRDREGFGVVTEIYCGDCQTLEEGIERAVNDAMADYVWRGDRVAVWPKRSTATN